MYEARNDEDKQRELNQLAIEHIDELEEEVAIEIFWEALQIKRSVQILNNLAYLYMTHEEDYEKAKPLLLEAVAQQPHSYFPFAQLGEVLMHEENWVDAKDVLEHSLFLQPNRAGYFNLGVAQFQMGLYKEAAVSFSRVATSGDEAHHEQVLSLYKAGLKDGALRELASFDAEGEDYVGDHSVANLYIEFGEYEKACDIFAPLWEAETTYPEREDDAYVRVWIYQLERYAYALYQLGEIEQIKEMVQTTLRLKEIEYIEYRQELIDDPDDAAYIHEAWEFRLEEFEKVPHLLEKLEAGYIPEYDLYFSRRGACYLFGCPRHGNADYEEYI